MMYFLLESPADTRAQWCFPLPVLLDTACKYTDSLFAFKVQLSTTGLGGRTSFTDGQAVTVKQDKEHPSFHIPWFKSIRCVLSFSLKTLKFKV